MGKIIQRFIFTVADSNINALTEALTLWIPQVVQGLDVLGVVHIVWILLRGQVEPTDANVVWQKQHGWVSYTGTDMWYKAVL